MKILSLFSLLLLASCSMKQGVVSAPVPAMAEPSSAPITVPVSSTIPAPVVVVEEMPAPSAPIVVKPNVSQPVTPSSQSAESHVLRYREISQNGIQFSLVSFDTQDYFLSVADQSSLGGSWSSSRNVTLSKEGLSAINGGFFNADGSPLGKVISQGAGAGSWNGASSLTSGVYQYAKGSPALVRSKRANRSSSELIQTGPFLVENGAVISGLSQNKAAQRSILLWDGKNHFAFGVTSSCSLAQLAQGIKGLPSSIPHLTALNLDGGRSTDLYVSPKVEGGGVTKGHWLKSQVRNYLVLRER